MQKFKPMRKRGSVTFGQVIIAVVVLAVLIVGGVFASMHYGGKQSTVKDAAGNDVIVTKQETSDTAPNLKFNSVDKYSKSTSLSNNVIYKQNGGAVQIDYDGTIGVNCHDKIEYLVNVSGYYSVQGTVADVPCTSNPQVNLEHLARDTAPSIQIYNQDDGTINSVSSTEGLIANSNDVQTVKIYPSYNKGIQGAAFFVNLLSTNVNTVTSSLGSTVDQPSTLTNNQSAGRASNTDKFYIFPISSLESKDNVVSFTFTPSISGTAYGLSNATIGLIDQEWYVSTDGTFKYGTQNDATTRADIGLQHHEFDTLWYTDST